jgi:glutamate synthase (NADPH) small chain
MSVIAETRSYSKYAWRDIAHQTPAKRAAFERAHDFREITKLYDENVVREQASRCLNCPHPTCREGCPLANRIPEWLALTAEGDFLGASEISQSTSNMPEICSRVCPQEKLCEGACILNARSKPVCIGAIEKFINEYAFRRGAVKASAARASGAAVAVIGSGPGGLACADQLAALGYAVTVLEAQDRAGGLLMNGIPAFKLEKSVVDRRVDVLRRRGVEFQLGVRVGKDVSFETLRKKFQAIFLAIGAQKAKPLDLGGSNLRGVFSAIPFLIQKNAGGRFGDETIDVDGKAVAVLGGGDTAMDCLRTALRCGAEEVTCIYRRDLANMPGSRKEYQNAVEEGARFNFLTNPVALEGERNLRGVRCVRMQLGAPDSRGRRSPEPIAESEFCIPAEVLLVAYGFDPEPLPEALGLDDLIVDRWGAIEVDENQMTSLPGVFAGGDISRGASLVVHAVRDGRTAASGIDIYLKG